MLAGGRSTHQSEIDNLPNELREFKVAIEEWLPHSNEKVAAKWQKMAEIYNRSLAKIKELPAYDGLDIAKLTIS
jgi:peptidyl-tRNA hydrolase